MGNFGLSQHYETAKKTGALRLSQKKLDELPSNLFALAAVLRTLDISENKFTRLPDAIGELTLLKQLNISRNKLRTLPETLYALSKLEGFKCEFEFYRDDSTVVFKANASKAGESFR